MVKSPSARLSAARSRLAHRSRRAPGKDDEHHGGADDGQPRQAPHEHAAAGQAARTVSEMSTRTRWPSRMRAMFRLVRGGNGGEAAQPTYMTEAMSSKTG